MKEFYTYHKEAIKVISIPSYTSFKNMITTNKKKTKNKTSNNFYYFMQLWVNSIVYLYPNKSDKEIFHTIMYIMKDEHNEIEFNVLNSIIKKAFENIKSKNPKYFTTPKHFIFDDKALSEYFNGDKEQIKKYKSTIILEYNKRIEIERKEETINNDIKSYIENGYYKHQIIEILLNKYSKDFVYRIIKSYEIKERSKKYIEIDKFIRIALNKSEKYISVKDMIEYLNQCYYFDNNQQKNIKVSERTYYNYLSVSNEIKTLIDKHNSIYLQKNNINDMNEETNEMNERKDDNFKFIDDEDLLEKEAEKIISWKEAEKINERKIEWTDADDDFFNSIKK